MRVLRLTLMSFAKYVVGFFHWPMQKVTTMRPPQPGRSRAMSSSPHNQNDLALAAFAGGVVAFALLTLRLILTLAPFWRLRGV